MPSRTTSGRGAAGDASCTEHVCPPWCPRGGQLSEAGSEVPSRKCAELSNALDALRVALGDVDDRTYLPQIRKPERSTYDARMEGKVVPVVLWELRELECVDEEPQEA